MIKPLAALLIGLGLTAGLACGRKGPLELPPERAPMAVGGLTAVQRGEAVVLEWTNPGKTISGRPLGPLAAVEIWVFDRGLPAGGRALTSAEIEKAARLVRRIPEKEFAGLEISAGAPASGMAFPVVFEPGPAGPKNLAFTVRVLNREKRASDFSPPVSVGIRTAPKPPPAVLAEVFSDHITIRWTRPDTNIDGTPLESLAGYAVYRSEGNGPPRKLTPALFDETSFEDRDFEFGKAYSYFLRAVSAGTDGMVESADSPIAKVVPRDIFPPAPPAGLVVLAGEDLVSLSWRPGTEWDLEGYRVWRKEAGQAAVILLAEGLVRENTFVDRSAAKGVSYVYGVSAVDRAGNASPPAESERVVVKGARP